VLPIAGPSSFVNGLEAAAVALFLASEESSFVTGYYVLVDGGYLAE